MATIDLGGGHGGRRSVDQELPLVPFIDFLLCLVTFLLVTAVWSSMARMQASALVPGPADDAPMRDAPRLHLEVGEQRFTIKWREGSTLVSSTEVPRVPMAVGTGEISYPDLAKQLDQEWRQHAAQRGPQDRKPQSLVLHTSNTLPYGEMVAVMDAAHASKRVVQATGKEERVSVYEVSLASE